MNVVITGSSKGIGLACCKHFLSAGHTVYGIDIYPVMDMEVLSYSNTFYPVLCDVTSAYLPDIKDVDILVNNAGIQCSDNKDVIDVNLKGLISTTEKYGLQPHIKSILNMASVSAHNGAEFDRYVASKGGVLSYTKWTAKHIAKYGATCNSLSFGGVLTELNQPVIEDEEAWNKIMSMTPLKKWMTSEECADWVYFFTVINKSCSGQDLIIDNMETLNHTFVW